jgi:hypothetical protein
MTARCETLAAPTALQWSGRRGCPSAELEEAVQRFIAPMLKQPRMRCAVDAGRWPRAAHGARREIEQDYFVATWTHPTHWAAVDRILNRSGAA